MEPISSSSKLPTQASKVSSSSHTLNISNASINNVTLLPETPTSTIQTKSTSISTTPQLYPVAPDGACMFRAFFAARTKDHRWLQQKTSHAVLHEITKSNLKAPIIDAINQALQNTAKALNDSDQKSGIAKAFNLEEEQELFSELLFKLAKYNFSERLYEETIESGKFTLWRTETIEEAIFENSEFILVNKDQFKTLSELVTNIITEEIIKALKIPINNNLPVHLRLQKDSAHYELIAPSDYFRTKQDKSEGSLPKTIWGEQYTEEEILDDIKINTENTLPCFNNDKPEGYDDLIKHINRVKIGAVEIDNKNKPYITKEQGINALGSLIAQGLSLNASYHTLNNNLNENPHTNPNSKSFYERFIQTFKASQSQENKNEKIEETTKIKMNDELNTLMHEHQKRAENNETLLKEDITIEKKDFYFISILKKMSNLFFKSTELEKENNKNNTFIGVDNIIKEEVTKKTHIRKKRRIFDTTLSLEHIAELDIKSVIPSTKGNELNKIIALLSSSSSSSEDLQKEIMRELKNAINKSINVKSYVFEVLDLYMMGFIENSEEFQNAFSRYYQKSEEDAHLYGERYENEKLKNFIIDVDLQKQSLNQEEWNVKAYNLFVKVILSQRKLESFDPEKLGFAFSALNLDKFSLINEKSNKLRTLISTQWREIEKTDENVKGKLRTLKKNLKKNNFELALVNPVFINQGAIKGYSSSSSGNTGFCNLLASSIAIKMQGNDLASLTEIHDLLEESSQRLLDDPLEGFRLYNGLATANNELQYKPILDGKHQGMALGELFVEHNLLSLLREILVSDVPLSIIICPDKRSKQQIWHNVILINVDIFDEKKRTYTKIPFLIDSNIGILPCYETNQLIKALQHSLSMIGGNNASLESENIIFKTLAFDRELSLSLSKLKTEDGFSYKSLFKEGISGFQKKHPLTMDPNWSYYFPQLSSEKRTSYLTSKEKSFIQELGLKSQFSKDHLSNVRLEKLDSKNPQALSDFDMYISQRLEKILSTANDEKQEKDKLIDDALSLLSQEESEKKEKEKICNFLLLGGDSEFEAEGIAQTKEAEKMINKNRKKFLEAYVFLQDQKDGVFTTQPTRNNEISRHVSALNLQTNKLLVLDETDQTLNKRTIKNKFYHAIQTYLSHPHFINLSPIRPKITLTTSTNKDITLTPEAYKEKIPNQDIDNSLIESISDNNKNINSIDVNDNTNKASKASELIMNNYETITKDQLVKIEIENKIFYSEMKTIRKQLQKELSDKGYNPENFKLKKPIEMHDREVLFVNINNLHDEIKIDITENIRLQESLKNTINKLDNKVINFENEMKKISTLKHPHTLTTHINKSTQTGSSVLTIYSFVSLINSYNEFTDDYKHIFALQLTDLSVDSLSNSISAANFLSKRVFPSAPSLSVLSKIGSTASVGLGLIINLAELGVYSKIYQSASSSLDKKIALNNLHSTLENLSLTAASISVCAMFPVATPIFMLLGFLMSNMQNREMKILIAKEMSNSAFSSFILELEEIEKLLSDPELIFDENDNSFTFISTKIPYSKLVVTHDAIIINKVDTPFEMSYFKSVETTGEPYELRIFPVPSNPESGEFHNINKYQNERVDYSSLLSKISYRFINGYAPETPNELYNKMQKMFLRWFATPGTSSSNLYYNKTKVTTKTLAECLSPDSSRVKNHLHELNKKENKTNNIYIQGRPIKAQYLTEKCYKLSYASQTFEPSQALFSKLENCENIKNETIWKVRHTPGVFRRIDKAQEDDFQTFEIYHGKIFGLFLPGIISPPNNRLMPSIDQDSYCYNVPDKVNVEILNPTYSLHSGGDPPNIYHFAKDNFITYLESGMENNEEKYYGITTGYRIEKSNIEKINSNTAYDINLIPNGNHVFKLYPGSHLNISESKDEKKNGEIYLNLSENDIHNYLEEIASKKDSTIVHDGISVEENEGNTVLHIFSKTKSYIRLKIDKTVERNVKIIVASSVLGDVRGSSYTYPISSSISMNENGLKIDYIDSIPATVKGSELQKINELLLKLKAFIPKLLTDGFEINKIDMNKSRYQRSMISLKNRGIKNNSLANNIFNGKGYYITHSSHLSADVEPPLFVSKIYRKDAPEKLKEIFERMLFIGAAYASFDNRPLEIERYISPNEHIFFFYDLTTGTLVKQYGQTEIRYWDRNDIVQCPLGTIPKQIFSGDDITGSYSCQEQHLNIAGFHGISAIVDFEKAANTFKNKKNHDLNFTNFVMTTLNNEWINNNNGNTSSFVVVNGFTNNIYSTENNLNEVQLLLYKKDEIKCVLLSPEERIVSISNNGIIVSRDKTREEITSLSTSKKNKLISLNRKKPVKDVFLSLYIRSFLNTQQTLDLNVQIHKIINSQGGLLEKSNENKTLDEYELINVQIEKNDNIICKTIDGLTFEIDKNLNLTKLISVEIEYLSESENIEDLKRKLLKTISSFHIFSNRYIIIKPHFLNKELDVNLSKIIFFDVKDNEFLSISLMKDLLSKNLIAINKTSINGKTESILFQESNKGHIFQVNDPGGEDKIESFIKYDLFQENKETTYLQISPSLSKEKIKTYTLPTMSSSNLVLLPIYLEATERCHVLFIPEHMIINLDRIILANSNSNSNSYSIQPISISNTSHFSFSKERISAVIIKSLEKKIKKIVLTIPIEKIKDGEREIVKHLQIELDDPFVDDSNRIKDIYSNKITLNSFALTSSDLEEIVTHSIVIDQDLLSNTLFGQTYLSPPLSHSMDKEEPVDITHIEGKTHITESQSKEHLLTGEFLLPNSDLSKTDPIHTISPSISEVIHAYSFMTAARFLSSNPNALIDVSMRFKNKACKKTVLKKMKKTPQDSIKILWESKPTSSRSSTSILTRLNQETFSLALTEATLDERGCTTSISVEMADFPEIKEQIKKENLNRKVLQELSIISNAKICRPVFTSSSGRIKKYDGKEKPLTTHLECRHTPQPIILNEQYLLFQKIAESICIKRLAIISTGIDDKNRGRILSTSLIKNQPKKVKGKWTRVDSTVNIPPSGNEKSANDFVASALRACPSINFDDIRSSTQIDVSSIENLGFITSFNLIEQLSALAQRSTTHSPQAIVIIDENESANYFPDVSEIENLVKKLHARGITTYCFASSPGSWLYRIKGIYQSSQISEILTKKVKF